MARNSRFKSLLVVGPPILLVLIGLSVYIFVTKLIAPEVQTVSTVPNQSEASESGSITNQASPTATPINPIDTEVTPAASTQLSEWQTEADRGERDWQLDPVSAAEQQAGQYGFIPGDQLTLVTNDQTQAPSKIATVIAIHGGQAYLLSMTQPKKTGESGIWVIQSIEKQS